VERSGRSGLRNGASSHIIYTYFSSWASGIDLGLTVKKNIVGLT